MPPLDPVAANVAGVQQLVGSKLNKTPYKGSGDDGVVSELKDALTLDLDDAELLKLENQSENRYRGYEAKMIPRQAMNKLYYLGKQSENTSAVAGGAIASNLIFEAEETFLPAALSKNPEPVVWCDNTPEGNKLADDVKGMLQYHADVLVLRRKLTLMVRNWSVDYLGIIKHGWDAKVGDIRSDVRDAKMFIFDPDGYIDPYGDYEGLLGERIKVTAERLTELFPEQKDFITLQVDGRMGTEVIYKEWWTDDFTFTTFKGKVFSKSKNFLFNQPVDAQEMDPMSGEVKDVEQPGRNHFARPKKPYTFLSVYSFGQQPHDVTGLIEQNIPNQRRVSDLTNQIAFNLSRQNNSDVFSEANFTQETAKQAATAVAKGHPVLIPSGGSIDEAIKRLPAQGIDASFFTSLETTKNDLRSIFGTQGITAQQQDEDQTARGMILNQQYDNTRIGGGIGDALEQVADNIFNWWVQLYYMFYDVPHVAAVLGQMKAIEYVTLTSQDMDRRIVISVSPNSMKPKDETTKMNQAMALWEAGALDPKTLLTVLDFPDPQTTAAQTVLWKTNPQMYMQLNFPDIVAEIQATMMAAAPQPGGGGAPPGSPQQGAPTGPSPEQMSEPEQPAAGVQASPSLNQVPLPK